MRCLSARSAVCVGAGLALGVASLPSPAHAARDICVKILEPVKSAASVAGGPAATGEVWTVEVAMGDCEPGPPAGSGPASGPPVPWPRLSFNAALDVSSGSTAICSATTLATSGGSPGPLPAVFRFRLTYPPKPKAQTPTTPTAQALPIPYVIRATAQFADGKPANNQGVATFRFAPGGTASCVPLQDPWHK